jgi:O-acetyl-ADP-ribose deacetylase (regulator of RNase III)
VTISIVQGDLTSTYSAVIVNSVPNTLTLRSGRISKAILEAAGDNIESEGNNISLLGIVE